MTSAFLLLAAALAHAQLERPQVVGGSAVESGQFPFLVRVETVGGGVCTGSLIADDWVLTAGHCRSPVRILIADALPPSRGEGHAVRWLAPKRWIRHPGFDPAARPVDFQNDIALIELDGSARAAAPTRDGVELYAPEPIGLAALPRDTSGSLGEMTIAGFGQTRNGGLVPAVAEWAAGVPTFEAERCLFPVSPSHDLCYGTFPNSCLGDSGGPIFQEDGGGWLQYGVVSIVTASCGAGNSRGAFLPGHLAWINEQMSEGAAGPIELGWELPASAVYGGVASGASQVQGWTYSSAGAIASVALYVDGQYDHQIGRGGDRGDVRRRRPGAPLDAGFSSVVNWARLGAGNHQLELVVTDTAGNVRSEVRTVRVVEILPGVKRLHDLGGTGACTFVDPGTLRCSGLSFEEGVCAGSMEIRWSNAKQAFEVSVGCE